MSLNLPRLVLHGEKDAVVPVGLGRRLFELANEPKRFVPFPEGTHVNLDVQGVMPVARAFLAGAY